MPKMEGKYKYYIVVMDYIMAGYVYLTSFSHSLSPLPPLSLLSSCNVIHFLMEKMPLKWLLVHQLTFVMAFLYVLLDLTNEVSSGTVTLAKDYMDELLTQVRVRIYDTVNHEYFVSKIFHAINFLTKYKRPCTALLLILSIYFRAFNFRTSQAVRKYFNNEIFAIYGSMYMYDLCSASY